jgi:drug/metabolite transporter (DMT)-like permease
VAAASVGDGSAGLSQLLAPLLALVSATSWGAADFAGGLTTRLSSNLFAVLMAQAVGLGLGSVLLVIGAEAMPGPEAVAWSLVAGVAGVLGVACFYLALSRGTMGLVAPLTALLAASIPALVGLIGGDVVSAFDLLGMAAALAAVVLISLPDRRLGSPVMPTYHGSRAREWLLIIVAGLSFAGFFLGIDAAQSAGGQTWWPLFLVKVAGVASVVSVLAGAALLGRRPALRVGRAALLTGAVAGTADFGGNLFFVLASDAGDLSIVVVLSSLYPVVTALLARAVLHERLGPVRLLGVGLAVAGVMLIGLGSL